MKTRYERENLETRERNERQNFFRDLTNLDRRSFLKVAAASFTAAAGAGMLSAGSFHSVNIALGKDETFTGTAASDAPSAKKSFKIAYISDSHLYEKKVNDRFVQNLVRAVSDVNAMEEQPDFVFYGGDLAQLGQPRELKLGARILRDLRAPLKIMVGEHDWYYDMGDTWQELFGSPNWSLNHKGVHMTCLMSVMEKDFWTERGLTPLQRMQTVAGLDNHVQSPFHVGEKQRNWLKEDLAPLSDDTPLIIFSHSPLYKLYKNWNFWTDDAEEVQDILKRFKRVTVIHGHTHQLLTNRIGNIHFHGLLSTAWPWPYAPEGMPELTIPMNRSDPFNPADGCGNGQLNVSVDGLVDKVYALWNREPILVSSAYLDSWGKEAQPPKPNLPSY